MRDEETAVAMLEPTAVPSDDPAPRPDTGGPSKGILKSSATAMGAAFAGYLGLSVVLWWNVWSTHPTSVAGCACDDPSLFVWFLEWPAHALAHGLNPFYSTAMFHPTGINLLSNTGVLAIGIPLAPVTWLFGPVATLNVVSTLGPAATALAMFWLLRRWVSWAPAAFVGGLLFGFSPYIFTNIAVDHLNASVLVALPLMVACLDELLVRQCRKPVVVGTALGLLAVLEFFVSTEVLVIAVLCAATGLVLLAGYALASRPPDLAGRARHAFRGLGVAALVAAVLLAYPTWFSLFGPAHFSGLVWPTITPGAGGTKLENVVHLHFLNLPALHLFAGYEGGALPEGEYLGIGMLAVLGVGLVLWRRDRRLWFFGGLGLVTLALSLGVDNPYWWLPWRAFVHVPIIQNVLPERVFAVTTVCAAAMLAIVVDRTRASARTLERGIGRWRVAPAAAVTVTTCIAAISVAAVALVPVGMAIATNVPLTVESMAIPPWFADVAPHLTPGQVILPFPPAVAGGAAMTWQAVDSLDFAMPTGGGPGSIPARAGPEQPGLDVITESSLVLSTPARATPANIAAVRAALSGWGVTMVVVPYPMRTDPPYDQGSGAAWALGMFTLAIGRWPKYRDDAWVWSGVRTPSPMFAISLQDFERCTSEQMWRSGPPQAVPECVAPSGRT